MLHSCWHINNASCCCCLMLYCIHNILPLSTGWRSNPPYISDEIHFNHEIEITMIMFRATAAVVVALCPATVALSLAPSGKNNIVAITHAAGRMGKALALQIREDAILSGMPSEELPNIRAIVRSESEAMSVKCDLGGMKMEGGNMAPIALEWLETVVVEDIENAEALRSAFEGSGSAILCDASHNEIVWKDGDGTDNQDGEGTCSIYVPMRENNDLSKRLLAEIDAASSCPSLRRVILRSSMGLSSGVSKEAAEAMGGEAALAGPREAEKALKSSGLEYTIIRLGALTDDGGNVPLIFGVNDAILEKRLDSTTSQRPPILSRADAARACTFLLRETSAFRGLTIDCAWHPKFGRSSVGSEEAVNAAGRQDLKEAIQKGVFVW
mmetsp:Transcript_8557/g.20927  ORF Transcript_8557/g.20927 Transcript_8557/m.20927 type:complete len:383 (+) Transcript_8557:117-1265(+)